MKYSVKAKILSIGWDILKLIRYLVKDKIFWKLMKYLVKGTILLNLQKYLTNSKTLEGLIKYLAKGGIGSVLIDRPTNLPGLKHFQANFKVSFIILIPESCPWCADI